jgi:hypothetical protein
VNFKISEIKSRTCSIENNSSPDMVSLVMIN